MDTVIFIRKEDLYYKSCLTIAQDCVTQIKHTYASLNEYAPRRFQIRLQDCVVTQDKQTIAALGKLIENKVRKVFANCECSIYDCNSKDFLNYCYFMDISI